ncbi:MAG: hypothetical protein AB9866_10915 [Syntrophobacteraceae bacterium]
MRIGKIRGKSLAVMVLVVAMLTVFAVAPAMAAVYVKNSWVRFSGTAAETLAVGDIVCIKDADGLVYKADANDAALRPAVGIVSKGASTSGVVGVTVIGVFGGYTTLSEGQNVYLSESVGSYTQSSPAYSQSVGFALTTTTVLYNFRNYLDTSALTALGTLTGATPLILEGATANDFETSITVTDPTADNTITLPDASGTAMLSSLATNGVDAANAVTGASNGLVFEGTTANAYETTITATDPTADRTWTLPDKSGTFSSTIKVVTDDANGKTVGAAEAGDVQTASGAGVWALPEASTCIGCVFDLAIKAAGNVDINPADADIILGLTNAAGDAIRCATAGSSIRLIVLDATNIVAFGPSCIDGTWTDVN